jgi:hypothetical protein
MTTLSLCQKHQFSIIVTWYIYDIDLGVTMCKMNVTSKIKVFLVH